MASSSCYIFIIIIIHSFIVSLSFCVFLHACKFECFEINNIKHCIFCYSNICWNRIILTPHTHAYVEIYVVWFYVVVCELAGFCMLLSRFWLFFLFSDCPCCFNSCYFILLYPFVAVIVVVVGGGGERWMPLQIFCEYYLSLYVPAMRFV